ncbi:Cold tolerance protein [Dirofilaria immitis]
MNVGPEVWDVFTNSTSEPAAKQSFRNSIKIMRTLTRDQKQPSILSQGTGKMSSIISHFKMIWMISGIYHSSHYIYEPISNNELVFNIMVRERNFPVRNVRNEKLNSEKKNKLPENSN